MIQFINQFPPGKEFTYDERIALLRELKVQQTEEKAKAGGADEDDYGLIEQDEYQFQLEPITQMGPYTAIRLGQKIIAVFCLSIQYIAIH